MELAGEIIGGDPNPDLEALNKKGIQKLYQLFDSLDEHSEPEMVLACTKGLAQLNSSLKGSDVFTPKETEEERNKRERADLVSEMLKRGPH